jgi:hypothetical protein
MDKHASDLEPMTAALMHADAPILMLNADAWSRIGGLLALVAEARAHGSHGLRNRDEPFEFFGLDEQRHFVSLINFYDVQDVLSAMRETSGDSATFTANFIVPLNRLVMRV